MRIEVLFGILLVAQSSWGQSELTGSQSAKPRVMVIFDNSRSMETRTDDDRDSRYYQDDLDGSDLTGGICDPSQPPTTCRNKFCVGKCVMHNVLDPYEDLLEVGFSTYYHYLRKTTASLSVSGPRTRCLYDVVAAPQETIGDFWSLENNLHEPSRCTISQVGSPAHENSFLDAWGYSLKCRSTAGIPEPSKTCQAVDYGADDWFFTAVGEHIRYSPFLPPPPVGASVGEPPEYRPYTNEWGLTGYGINQVSRYTFSNVGPSNGREYYLYRESKTELTQKTPATCTIGEQRHFWSPPAGAQGGNWSVCTAQNPCFMTLKGAQSQWDYLSLYSRQTAPPPGYEFQETSGPFGPYSFNRGSDNGLTCPSSRTETSGVYGNASCTAQNPCTFVDGQRVAYEETTQWSDTITSSTPESQTVNGVTYEWKGQTSVKSLTQDVAGSDGTACPSSYMGLPYASYTQLPVEPPMVRCEYRTTSYILVASSTSSTTSYRCDYRLYSYLYRTSQNLCLWERTDYDWRPKKWKYRWQTAGGEILATYKVTGLEGQNACTSVDAQFSSSELGQKCPAVSTTVHPACGAVPGRYCRLRWRTGAEGYQAYSRGRSTNYNSNWAWSPEPLYCRSADYQNTPTPAPPPWTHRNDWCEFTNTAQSQTFEDTFVMSDPFTPGSTNRALAIGSEASLGGRVQSVAYSVDGVQWTQSPPLATKEAGWSRLSDKGSASPRAPAMSFVPIGPANETLPLIRRIMEKRTPENPAGLVMPTRPLPHRVTGSPTWVTGLNTPLYGSLTNARDYLVNEVLPNDAQASCRSYSVILVTDGDEYQPPNQPQHPGQTFNQYASGDLVNAVRELRQLSGSAQKPLQGVKTYVVGFGSSFTASTLNAMAVEAGTALDGKAYNASSPKELQLQLKRIFNEITNNRYTRSKPVVSYTGDRMYVGAFRVDVNSLEWSGELNAYNLTNVGVEPNPVWQFHDKLNQQSSSLRQVFTYLPQTGTLNLENLGARQASELYAEMGVSSGVGAEVLNFVLNPSRNAPFANSSTETKRSRLSSVFHSTPVLVGAPPFQRTWAGPDTQDMLGYDLFKAAHANRGERIFVGSNTGMVHALCEKTSAINSPSCGVGNQEVANEVYAFIPPSVLPKLNRTRNGHTFTVDGSFGIADVCLNQSCDGANKWMSLLLGSMHKGGRSLYALDVTSAEKPRFLWEFAEPSLGETWSPPTVVRAQVDLATGEKQRWVGILGGGYWSPGNGTQDISNSVLVVDLHQGQVLADKSASNSTAGVARFRVDYNPPECATDARACLLPRNSVPARIAVRRINESARVKQAFFGDTQGRLWSMNLLSTRVVDWKPEVLFDASRKACSTDLFGSPVRIDSVEVDPSLGAPALGTLPFPGPGDPRPMYQRVVHSQDAEGRALVFAGTGDVNDPSWVGSTPLARDFDYLYAVRYTGGSPVCTGIPLWVKRLRQGEKVLSEGTVGNKVVFMPTYMPPGKTDAENGCGKRGNARIYAFYQTSGNPAKVFDPDLNPATENNTHILELPDEGVISDLLFVADSTDSSRGRVVYATDSGEPRARPVSGLSSSRHAKSWRRIH